MDDAAPTFGDGMQDVADGEAHGPEKQRRRLHLEVPTSIFPASASAARGPLPPPLFQGSVRGRVRTNSTAASTVAGSGSGTGLRWQEQQYESFYPATAAAGVHQPLASSAAISTAAGTPGQTGFSSFMSILLSHQGQLPLEQHCESYRRLAEHIHNSTKLCRYSKHSLAVVASGRRGKLDLLAQSSHSSVVTSIAVLTLQNMPDFGLVSMLVPLLPSLHCVTVFSENLEASVVWSWKLPFTLETHKGCTASFALQAVMASQWQSFCLSILTCWMLWLPPSDRSWKDAFHILRDGVSLASSFSRSTCVRSRPKISAPCRLNLLDSNYTASGSITLLSRSR